MKTAEEHLFVMGVFNELHNLKRTDLLKDIKYCMEMYARGALDEAAKVAIGDDNVHEAILNLKSELK